MRKRTGLLLSTMVGLATLFIPFFQAEGPAAPSQPDFPSCNSFGVQRFQDKKEAPSFTLNCLDGKPINLGDYKGKPLLITFWATWCASCKEELPILEKFWIGKKDQFALLLITIDGERKKAVQKIVEENKLTLPVLLLLKEKCMDQYGVRGWVPQTFLIDREGMLVGKTVGQRDWSSPEAWSCLKELFNLR